MNLQNYFWHDLSVYFQMITECEITKLYFHRSVWIKHKIPLATNDSKCICHLTETDHNYKNLHWKLLAVMIKVYRIFVLIKNHKNKIFFATVLKSYNSEKTSNKLQKALFCSALIQKSHYPWLFFYLEWWKAKCTKKMPW